MAARAAVSLLLIAARAAALLPLRRAAVPRRRRACGSALAMRTDAALKEGIASFYDESSGIWEAVWGEHMHHGFYAPGERAGSFSRHLEAQDDMIEKSLELCGADDVAARCAAQGRRMRVIDFGCGIGGSARYIARKYNASVVGYTLSPEQARRGNELSAGLDVELRAADATATDLEDGAFDLVWSMESGEHMPDKPKFVHELGRLCRPGGAVSCVTWCHRDLALGKRLGVLERAVLGAINYCYYLPRWCSGADYQRLFRAEPGFGAGATAKDWTRNIAPFWPAVARSAVRLRNLRALLRTGRKTVRGAVAILLMILGYKLGTVKFVAVAARKEDV